jgi:murein L,D-transpeptidase YcbB/YkuD
MENNNNRRACSAWCCAGWLLLQLFSLPAWSSVASGNNPVKAHAGTAPASSAASPAADIFSTTGMLPSLYEQSGYTPVWSNPLAVRQLLEAIRNCTQHGLDPEDYHLTTLELLLERRQASVGNNYEHTAQLDLLLSDSLIRLGSHLAHGKDVTVVEEEMPAVETAVSNPQLIMQTAHYISSARVDEWLQGMTPQSGEYTRLQDALARYRYYRQLGGWQPLPDGPPLETGMVDPRVPLLRARLIATGDLGVQDMHFPTFDDAVAQAVMRFQRRHGLDADGVVGSRTQAALNVPVETRIEQILVNMERARSTPAARSDTYVLVDIAGLKVSYMRNGKSAWQGRAIVGRPQRMSPVLHSHITYLDLNPSWTVPPTVLGKDVLPELQRDPGWLLEKDMQVVDYQGNPVDSAAIDWARYSGRNFPWLIRQQPGRENALGQIKFMFPNPYSVYLHDTPSRKLFDQPQRALSSGCIRIEQPVELAALLLEDTPGWDRARLDSALDSHRTRSVGLRQPVEILLRYRTVTVEGNGTVFFHPDIYGHDEPVIQALRDYQPEEVPARWLAARTETP